MADDLFDLLIKVRNAAEVANGNAQELIRDYRRNRSYFSYEWAANLGIEHVRQAQKRATARDSLVDQHTHIKHLHDVTRDYRNGTQPALDLIRRAVGLRAAPIYVGDYSYPTAHEAAEALGRETWRFRGLSRFAFDENGTAPSLRRPSLPESADRACSRSIPPARIAAISEKRSSGVKGDKSSIGRIGRLLRSPLFLWERARVRAHSDLRLATARRLA